MGGVSTAGLRPGLGFGGSTHVLFMEIAGALTEPGVGASSLLIAEGIAGIRTGGESASKGEVRLDNGVGWDGATW